MSLWRIAWAYLWNRRLTTCLTILSVGLAVGLISAVLTLREETRKRFEDEGQAFDLVVGAKGSPLQLVLSSVYFMDEPTGNIPFAEYERLKKDTEYVAAAFPIGLGDSYHGFRIVGTDRALFDHTWTNTAGETRAPFKLAEGAYFTSKMQAVLGGTVARQEHLKVGDTFISTHGMIEMPADLQEESHANLPYTVVGIMKQSGTPFDRAIFCNMESVWAAHAHKDTAKQAGDIQDRDASSMITAALVQLQSPGYRWQYKEYIRENTPVMAAVPIEEIRKLYDQLLGTAKTVLLAVGYLVVVISALSILIGLYLSILQRKRDLAIMRALGASAYEIFGAVIIEAFWVTMLGIATGWLLGKSVAWGLGRALNAQFGLTITPYATTSEEITAFAVVGIVGLLAGVLPAWQAYRRNIARDLSER